MVTPMIGRALMGPTSLFSLLLTLMLKMNSMVEK
jgi:hypothetical protein